MQILERYRTKNHLKNSIRLNHFKYPFSTQSQFIDKNKDPLHGSLEVLLQESANPFVKQLFTAKNDSASLRGKLNLISIGSKIKSEMSELMEKLEQNVTLIRKNVTIESNLEFIDLLFSVPGHELHSLY